MATTAYINALEQQRALEERAQREATQRKIDLYTRQQNAARADSSKYMQAADIQKQFNVRDANQVMAAQGRTGGLSETSLLRNQSAYQNSINSIRQKLGTTLQEIDDLISNEQTTGNNELAKIRSNYNTALQSILASAGSSGGSGGGLDYVEPPTESGDKGGPPAPTGDLADSSTINQTLFNKAVAMYPTRPDLAEEYYQYLVATNKTGTMTSGGSSGGGSGGGGGTAW